MEALKLELNSAEGRPEEIEVHYRPGRLSPESAVLYMHGFGSSQDGSKALYFRQRFAAAGLTFCSLDFRGHGRSSGGMFDLTLSRNLQDVVAVHRFLASRGHRRLILVGSSMGGLTGLWHGALNPQDVVAAVFFAPALGLDQTFADWLGEEAMRGWRQEGRLEVTNELGSWDLGWGFVEDFERFEVRSLEASYRIPSLLLQGCCDDRVPWRSVLDFSLACTTGVVDLHLFPDGDHRLTDLQPRMWELMRDFLDSHDQI